MTDDEARVHFRQATTVPATMPPAPDVDETGKRTMQTSAADDLDRLRAKMIGVAIARDADGPWPSSSPHASASAAD